MSNHTSRALRATVAAAGAATLGLSFVGTAAASGAPRLGGLGGNDADGDSNSHGARYNSDSSNSMLGNAGSPSIDNELLTFEMPRVENTSYDSNYGDDDGVCHGTGGSEALPDGIGVFQHPCESHDNSFGQGSVDLFGYRHYFDGYQGSGDDSGDDDSGDDSYGDGEHGLTTAAYSTPLASDDSPSNVDTSDFGDSSDSNYSDHSDGSDNTGFGGLMSHDSNSGDTDQSSPVMSMMGSSRESPVAGMTKMNGYSFGMNNG